MSIKDRFISFIQSLQDTLCKQVEEVDGVAKFKEDKWERPEGGGGVTRIISNGRVFEKGGINTSVVFGKVTDAMRTGLKISGDSWFACGISSVLHPVNPFVPTVHFNYRYFELYDEGQQIIDSWFGGGTDLTPFYLFEEDARHFHSALKQACDKTDTSFYREFKRNCDNYFVNTHRNNERRGIGGIFYDYLRTKEHSAEQLLQLAANCGNAFTEAYLPLVRKHSASLFTPQQKYWQEIRRGRYTEFNLVHDRGTLFGLKTNGRTESILMSLPPTVRFDYNYLPAANSAEEKLLNACLQPEDWVNYLTEEEKALWAKQSNTC